MKYSFENGFTLVEILITITIVSILATATLMAINPSSRLSAARDSKRRVDLNSLSKALELYVAEVVQK
jgi:prepilin-type N-terminal cleavage/methylation domain-containing protein